MIAGKPDEIEPDGAPNKAGIPRSTLQSNIWYHLGLAYYLQGDLAHALDAYREGMKVSKEIFEKVLAGCAWAAFGFIAAEADLKRGL